MRQRASDSVVRPWTTPSKNKGEPMPQTIHRGIKALIDEANAEIETHERG